MDNVIGFNVQYFNIVKIISPFQLKDLFCGTDSGENAC